MSSTIIDDRKKPTARQIIFNWIMGEEDLSRTDGWWGTTEEVEKADLLMSELSKVIGPRLRQEEYGAGVREALTQPTQKEMDDASMTVGGARHEPRSFAALLFANRLRRLTAPQEPKEDPAVAAVRAKLNEFQSTTTAGVGPGDVMGEFVAQIIAAVDRARADRK